MNPDERCEVYLLEERPVPPTARPVVIAYAHTGRDICQEAWTANPRTQILRAGFATSVRRAAELVEKITPFRSRRKSAWYWWNQDAETIFNECEASRTGDGEPPMYVYRLEEEPLYAGSGLKVGSSWYGDKRFPNGLSSGNARRLRVIDSFNGCRRDEENLHAELLPWRVRNAFRHRKAYGIFPGQTMGGPRIPLRVAPGGQEWFWDCADVLEVWRRAKFFQSEIKKHVPSIW